jgi:ParB/RepB/Spo0J family partition protein
MPAPEPVKKTAKDRMRSMVESAVSVLDEKKRPAAELDETNTLEDAAVRTTLKRNRSYGDLEIEKIRPDPDQVRKVDTSSESFAELLASVREHGVLEPITVRWLEEQKLYQVVTGERRYLASQRAGLKTIPAIVRDVDDTTKAVHQLVENLQRENMNPIDEARAFHRYLAATQSSQDDLAKRIGKSKTYVSRMMSILEKLTRDEQEEIGRVAPAQLPGKSVIIEALRLEDPRHGSPFSAAN